MTRISDNLNIQYFPDFLGIYRYFRYLYIISLASCSSTRQSTYSSWQQTLLGFDQSPISELSNRTKNEIAWSDWSSMDHGLGNSYTGQIYVRNPSDCMGQINFPKVRNSRTTDSDWAFVRLHCSSDRFVVRRVRSDHDFLCDRTVPELDCGRSPS